MYCNPKIMTVSILSILISCAVLRARTVLPPMPQKYDGILESHMYGCSTPGPTQRRLLVYLPEGYYESDARFPVIYMLHGANGNEESWIRKGRILERIDSLFHCGKIGEYIYVFPNTNRYANKLDYMHTLPKKTVESYLDLNGSIEEAFVNDVVGYIDRNFRTLPERMSRAICGLSLGALHSLYISANNPSTFGHIGLFSPIIFPALNFGRDTHIYRGLEEKLEVLFRTRPATYMIMIGKKDIFLNSARRYSTYLMKKNYDFCFILTSGGHKWDNWICYSTLFIESVFNFQLIDLC